jgi:hypothetical protein
MSQSKPVIPRFTIMFWTVHSSLPNTQMAGTENELAQQLKELREDGDVTAIATYSFFNAQQRTVRFQPLSST